MSFSLLDVSVGTKHDYRKIHLVLNEERLPRTI